MRGKSRLFGAAKRRASAANAVLMRQPGASSAPRVAMLRDGVAGLC